MTSTADMADKPALRSFSEAGFIRLKVITSHTELARFLAECEGGADDAEELGYIPTPVDIPSPYRSAPYVAVYKWRGFRVIWRETRHKRYEVFSIPADAVLVSGDD